MQNKNKEDSKVADKEIQEGVPSQFIEKMAAGFSALHVDKDKHNTE